MKILKVGSERNSHHTLPTHVHREASPPPAKPTPLTTLCQTEQMNSNCSHSTVSPVLCTQDAVLSGRRNHDSACHQYVKTIKTKFSYRLGSCKMLRSRQNQLGS